MVDTHILHRGRLYFSYSQFHVFDESVKLSGCDWSDAHYRQGFARRDQTVNFGTPLEFGHADLTVVLGPYVPTPLPDRAIEVPLRVSSGKVLIMGPDEIRGERSVSLPPGEYRAVAAQTVTADDQESITLYLEQMDTPLRRSRILVADNELEIPDQLIETADIA